MKKYFLFLFSLSRPRFWLYLAGPFLLGSLAGGVDRMLVWSPYFWLGLLFFLVIANIFLYGINDLYDRDTDSFNLKKGTQEIRLQFSQLKQLKITLVMCGLFFVIIFFSLSSVVARILLVLFFLLSYGYSAPPWRFKARPLLDSASNLLYALPGFIAYAERTGQLPGYPVIIAAWCWVAGMHLFSAIPDIESDRQANLTTTAVMLGGKKSLGLCGAVWLVSWITGLLVLKFSVVSWIGAVYPLIIMGLLLKPSLIVRVYWVFPYINMVFGFLLFLTIVI